MAIIVKRNGNDVVPDDERLADIKEKIRTGLGRTKEDAEIYVVQLQQRVRKYERRYEMTSPSMIKMLKVGGLQETRDISLWAWTWLTLQRLNKETPTTGIR